MGAPSVASMAQSGVTSVHQPHGPAQSDELMDSESSWTGATMGAIYTVCQQKEDASWLYIIIRLVAHWLQLWLLIVQPPAFNIDTSTLGWRLLSFINIKQFMSIRGYTFFVACFYLLIAGIALSVAAGVYLAWSFHKSSWPAWVPRLLRVFSRIFYQTFDIFTLNMLLINLDCQMYGVKDKLINMNAEFPEVSCFQMPHQINVGVSIVFFVIVVCMQGMFAVGEVELDLSSQNPMAFTNGSVELQTVLIRAAMAAIATLIYIPQWCAASLFMLSAYLTYLWWRWQPHMAGWPNHVRTGMYLSVAWCSWLYCVTAFSMGYDASAPGVEADLIQRLTYTMGATVIPFGMLGYLASWLREKYYRVIVLRKFTKHETDVEHGGLDPYTFTDVRQCEIVVRCCRERLTKDLPTLDPEKIQLAYNVIQIASTQLSKDPFMTILHASFLINVQDLHQRGYQLLAAAERMDLSHLLRLATFTLNQQHTQRSANSTGTRAADLASYVEFQRNYSLALKTHKDVLMHMKRCWELLLHDTVQMRQLERCTMNMANSITQADKVYRTIMQRNGTNVKLVRLWAKYLEHVKMDPWGAAAWFMEADRLEALQENEKAQNMMENWETDDPGLKDALAPSLLGHSTAAGDPRGAIIMNAQSQIQMANQICADILGYSRAEMRSKDIKLILPPQIADVHPTFVANYVQTGKATVLNTTMQQVALHKDRRLVPIILKIHKIRGTGEDTLFLGIITALPMDPGEATMWVTSAGLVMGVCENYEDWFGFPPKDVSHKPIASLATKGSKQIDEALALARANMTNGPRPPSPPEIRSPFKGMPTTNKKKIHSKQGSGQASPRRPPRNGKQGSNAEATRNILEQQLDGPVPPAAAVDPDVEEEEEEEIPLNEEDKSPRSMGGLSGTEDDSVNRPLQMAPAKLLTNTAPSVHANTGMATGSATLPTAFTIEELGNAWRLQAVPMAHKYSNDTVVDITITNAGMASLKFHVIKLRRRWDIMDGQSGICSTTATTTTTAASTGIKAVPGKQKSPVSATAPKFEAEQSQSGALATTPATVRQDLMMVVNSIGKVCHMTTQLADRLGRPRSKIGMAPLSIEQLLTEPFAQIHRMLLQANAPTAVPLYSCRTGMSVLLSSQGVQGRSSAMPFKLSIRKRQDVEEIYHVVHLQESSFDQALDERRLLYELDDRGVILSNQSTHATSSLFGFEPDALVGRSLLTILDIMKGKDGQPIKVAKPEDPSCEDAYRVMLELVSQSFQKPGISWRVGVVPPSDLAGAAFKLAGGASKVKPAIMRLAVTTTDAEGSDEGSISIQLELWRAEVASTVINLDAGGHILPIDIPEIEELCPPGLVLGAPFSCMVDKHIGSFLMALKKKAITSLFVPGAIGPPPGQANTAGAKRGGLKSTTRSVGNMGDARAGPQQTLTITHSADSSPLNLCIQAVRKSGQNEAAYSLIIRPMNPSAGRPDFTEWLLNGTSAMDGAANLMSRRGSALGLPRSKVTMFDNGGGAKPVLVAGTAHDFSADKAYGRLGGMGAESMRRNGGGDQPLKSMQSVNGEQENALGEEAQQVMEDDDLAGDAEEEENTINDNDYKRGQRYKRLYRMFNSPVVQGPTQQYTVRAYISFVFVCAIQLGVFILMLTMLNEQKDLVKNLQLIGEAGKAASDVGLYARLATFQYDPIYTVKGLRLMDGTKNLPYVLKLFKDAVDKYSVLHRGAYLGYSKPRRMPVEHGLRDLWENDNINITSWANIQYSQTFKNMTSKYLQPYYYNMSLWAAGNAMVQKANSFWQNINTYNTSQKLLALPKQPDLQWIAWNIQVAIFPNYRETLDGYVRVVLDQMTTINTVQLILLGVVGVGAALTITVWNLVLLQRMSYRRFSMYYILMAVPSGLVRRLVARRIRLDDDDDEDGQDDEAFNTSSEQATATNRDAPLMAGGGDGTGASSKNMSLKSGDFSKAGSGSNCCSNWLPACLKRKKHPSEMRSASGKKKLLPAYRSTVLLLLPVLVWGTLVILSNAIGYMLVSNSQDPISLFNEVNYVSLLYERNNFFIQEMMQYTDLSQVAAARSLTAMRMRQLEKEYKLMLYGAQLYPNETSFHFTSIKTGMAYLGGQANDILFNTATCLALNATECQPTNSTLYQTTRTGLDRMMNKYIELGQYVETLKFKDPFVNGPEYFFFWQTRPDMSGGFARLVQAYADLVNANLESVITLHMIALMVTLALVLSCIFFVLRPALRGIQSEGRVMALLLSQLPAEVDVNGLLKRTLLLDMGAAGGGGAPTEDEKQVMSAASSVEPPMMDTMKKA